MTNGPHTTSTTACWSFASDVLNTAGSWAGSSSTAGTDLTHLHLIHWLIGVLCLFNLVFMFSLKQRFRPHTVTVSIARDPTSFYLNRPAPLNWHSFCMRSQIGLLVAVSFQSSENFEWPDLKHRWVMGGVFEHSWYWPDPVTSDWLIDSLSNGVLYSLNVSMFPLIHRFWPHGVRNLTSFYLNWPALLNWHGFCMRSLL